MVIKSAQETIQGLKLIKILKKENYFKNLFSKSFNKSLNVEKKKQSDHLCPKIIYRDGICHFFHNLYNSLVKN